MRNKLERAKALRKLYERQLSKTPTRLPEGKRQAMAASMMDELVGSKWRDDITLADTPVLDVSIVAAAPVPTVGGPVQTAHEDSFVKRVRQAASDEGEHPDSVVFFDSKQEKPVDNIRRTLSDMHRKICELMGLVGR